MGGAFGCTRWPGRRSQRTASSSSEQEASDLRPHDSPHHIEAKRGQQQRSHSSSVFSFPLPKAASPASAASASHAQLLPAASSSFTAAAVTSSISSATSAFGLPAVLQRHMLRLSHLKRLKLVKRTMFREVLGGAELSRLSRLFEVLQLEAGSVLFHQGAVADVFYIVWRGEVSVKFSDRDGLLSTEGGSARQLSVAAATGDGKWTAAPASLSPEQPKRQLTAAKTPEKRRANSMQVHVLSDAAPEPPPPPQPASPRSQHQPPSSSRSPKAAAAASPPSSLPRFFSQRQESSDKASRGPPSLASVASIAMPASDLVAASVGRESSPSSFALLATKTAGDWLGLEALRVGRQLRTCACVASTQCTLLSLPSTAFRSFVSSLDDDKQRKLSDMVGDSIQACLHQMPYLAGVSAAKLSLLSSLFVWHMLPQQAVLFEEGARERKGNGLYFLYSGTVGVYCKDAQGESRLLKELQPGVCFGELGLIIHLPRTATIRAHTDCLLLHLPHRSFHNFLHLAPEILTHFREQIETYQLNVLYLLENELIAHYFFIHCQREYSTENMEFWREARDFRQQEMDAEQRRAEAQRIVQLYITDSSSKQINLKGNTQRGILQAMQPLQQQQQAQGHVSGLKQSHSHSSMSPPKSPTSPASASEAAAPSLPSSSASPRSPRHQTVDSQLFMEAESEIFNLLATDSFSRFKASPLFRECLEEMHARVRSSSISLGKGGVQGINGFSPSPSPTSSGLRASVQEGPEGSSPSGSPKSQRLEQEDVQEEGKSGGGSGARNAAAAQAAVSGQHLRSRSTHHSSQRVVLKRSATVNTPTGLGGAAGSAGRMPPPRSPLRRTHTNSKLSASARLPTVDAVLSAAAKDRTSTEAERRGSQTARLSRTPRAPPLTDKLRIEPPPTVGSLQVRVDQANHGPASGREGARFSTASTSPLTATAKAAAQAAAKRRAANNKDRLMPKGASSPASI